MIPGHFGRLRPVANARALAAASAESAAAARFLDVGAKMNVPRKVQASLPSLAEWVKGRIDFRILFRPPSPPKNALHRPTDRSVLCRECPRDVWPPWGKGLCPAGDRGGAGYPRSTGSSPRRARWSSFTQFHLKYSGVSRFCPIR